MQTIVKKYGGSSVASTRHMQRIARHLAGLHRDGHRVVVVVSAMGDMTDRLVAHVSGLTDDPTPRETDLVLSTGEQISSGLLALAVQEHGVPAIALTGRQAGIVTDEQHTRAHIAEVRSERIERELEAGHMVIVAGYQGISRSGETTTLGRGGSDTTAVALAGALGAPRCEIGTDVDAVYSADPRVVPDARPIPAMRHATMLRLARLGASVLHPNAVEEAQRRGVTIHLRGSFSEDPGTLVRDDARPPDEPVIAVTGRDDVITVDLEAPPSDAVREALARFDIISTMDQQGRRRRLLLSAEDGTGRHVDDLRELAALPGVLDVGGPEGMVAIVADGPVAASQPAAKALGALKMAGIPAREQHVAGDVAHILVPSDMVDDAVRAAHEAIVEVVAA